MLQLFIYGCIWRLAVGGRGANAERKHREEHLRPSLDLRLPSMYLRHVLSEAYTVREGAFTCSHTALLQPLAFPMIFTPIGYSRYDDGLTPLAIFIHTRGARGWASRADRSGRTGIW